MRALILEGIRFVGSGLLVFPIGLLVSFLCHELLGWREEYAGFAAIAVLLLLNFVLARVFVFRSVASVGMQLPKFLAIALVMRGMEYLLFLTIFKVTKISYLLAMVAALVISSLTKFFLYRSWVFGRANA